MECQNITKLSGITFCDMGASLEVAGGDLTGNGTFVFSTPPTVAPAPTDLSDLANKAYVDAARETWYAPRGDVLMDVGCNNIVDVSGFTFCDGTTINTGSSIAISSDERITAVSVPTSSVSIDGSTNTIAYSTAPVLLTPPLAPLTYQLIPRSYMDTMMANAFAGMAGYLPGTCFNIKKNVTRTGGNLTANTAQGSLFFLYPFIDTPISKVVTHTTTSTLPSGTTVGFALYEYNNITDISGTCVAYVNDLTNANIWGSATTQYTTPFTVFSPIGATSYTLKAGKKYAVGIYRDPNSTTFTLMGFGMTSSDYSGAIYVGVPAPSEMQTSGAYNKLDGSGNLIKPTLGTVVTQTSGSGFCVQIGLVP